MSGLLVCLKVILALLGVLFAFAIASWLAITVLGALMTLPPWEPPPWAECSKVARTKMDPALKIFLEKVGKTGLYEAIMYYWETLADASLEMKIGRSSSASANLSSFVSTLSDDEILMCALTKQASHACVAQRPLRLLLDRKLPLAWWRWALDEGGGGVLIARHQYREAVGLYLYAAVQTEEDAAWVAAKFPEMMRQ